MPQNKQCVVIFPIYKSLTEAERVFYENSVSMTKGFDKVFIAPKGYVKDQSLGEVLSDIPVEYFRPLHFENILGYNYLMLAKEFYQRFCEYEYMLICQSDAYIFKSELAEWCNKGYSYIGAPWVSEQKWFKWVVRRALISVFPKLYPKAKRKKHLMYYGVGNGGLSLRRIADFASVLDSKKAKKVLEVYKSKFSNDDKYNEDVFWGIEAQFISKGFKVPGWKEAARFSMELNCKYISKRTGSKLPFGCHAPWKSDIDFWRQLNIIPGLRSENGE